MNNLLSCRERIEEGHEEEAEIIHSEIIHFPPIPPGPPLPSCNIQAPFAHQTELMPALCFSIKLQMVPRSHLTLHTQKGAKINNLQPEGQQKDLLLLIHLPLQ